MQNYGDTPYIENRMLGQVDFKRLLYSERAHCFDVPVSIPGGMGLIPQGTVMGQISTSTNRKNLWVPKVQEAITVGLENPAIAKLVQDGAADAYAYVKIDDSYRFAIGDSLVGSDSDTDGASAIDLGAVTAIDRATYTHMAKITVTNNLTAALEVAKGACIWIQTLTTAPYTKAKGILLYGVDTGEGEDAKGAQGVVIVKNAMLYTGSLVGWDSDAGDDITHTDLAQYTLI